MIIKIFIAKKLIILLNIKKIITCSFLWFHKLENQRKIWLHHYDVIFIIFIYTVKNRCNNWYINKKFNLNNLCVYINFRYSSEQNNSLL